MGDDRCTTCWGRGTEPVPDHEPMTRPCRDCEGSGLCPQGRRERRERLKARLRRQLAAVGLLR